MASDIQQYLRVDVAPDGLTASLYPTSACPARTPKPRDLIEVLARAGVVEGVDPDVLALFIEDWDRGTIVGPRVVATGTAPKPAAVPSLKRVAPPARSGQDPVELLPLFVKRDEVIFALGSTGTARVGRSVRGEVTQPDPRAAGGPVPGSGILVRDGRWVATETGFLVIAGDRIDVSHVLTHNRDLPPGDYRWNGDAVIRGDIPTGCSLRIDGSIRVEGTIHDGVVVRATGNVEITGAVEGHDSRVVATGDVHVGAAIGSTLTAEGNVTVQRETQLATVRARGRFIADSNESRVRGARIDAVAGAAIHVIEELRSQRTTVSVGSSEWIVEECKAIEGEIERWIAYRDKQFEAFRSRYGKLLENRARIHRLPPAARREFEAAQKSVRLEQERVDQKICELRTRQNDLDRKRTRDDSAVVDVKNGAPDGTRFAVRGREYLVSGTLPKGHTICVNQETGRAHAVPTGIFVSSELFA